MPSAAKYAADDTPGASSIDVTDPTHKSSERFLSRENLMIGKCDFEKKTFCWCMLFILALAVSAVLGIVISMYTIANLQTYNIQVEKSSINLANVLISRDKALIYLPGLRDGSIAETQTIVDDESTWVAVVNRPKHICFLRKVPTADKMDISALKSLVEKKRKLQLSYGAMDNQWVTRGLTESEMQSLSGFIYESCQAKEMVVMSFIGLPPTTNTTSCQTFCLPQYKIMAKNNMDTLQVTAVNCVPARCENRF